MKKIYFLSVSLFFFLTVGLFAQDQKWSVEANYPLPNGEVYRDNPSGIIDLGVKYRFLDFNIVEIGVGVNTGVFDKNLRDEFNDLEYYYDETNWSIQPKVFAEFTIPGMQKLHPGIGLGYTFIKTKYESGMSGEPTGGTKTSGGLTLNVGLSYDITKRLFLQAQYDFINDKDIVNDAANNLTIGSGQNRGYLKVGVGLRF